MKKILSILLLSALLLTFAGCGAEKPAESPVAPAEETVPAEEAAPAELTVTDNIGREVTVTPGEYKRVVCIGAGALRMYCYIGDVFLLCGVEDIDNTTLAERPKMFDAVARPYVLAYGDVFASLPSCGVGGPQAQTAEAEKLLSCDPDIVISEYEDADKANALQQQLGVPVITLSAGPDGVFAPEFAASMRLLGQVFGREERAEELVSFVEAQTEEITERTASVPEADRPGAYICGLGNWGTTNHLMTSETYRPFAVANIRNCVTGLGAKGVQALEKEKFVALGEEMDVMILDAASVKNIQPLFAEDPALFDTCKAWQTGEVYLQMAYNAYYTNFEIALANAWFNAKTVYPALFTDVDMTEKLDEITTVFLGRPLADEIFACPASFGGYQRIDPAAFFG